MNVLITGAAKGLGAYTALKFAANNYDIIINYNHSESAALNLKEEIEKKFNVKVLLIKADITNDNEIDKMFDLIKKEFNKLDVLVNNAAICFDSLVEDKNRDSFLDVLNTNLVSPFVLMKKVKKIMDNGSIINISSTNAIDTYYPYSMDYDASKAGLNSLTHNFAKEYAPNIRVNAVACGWINTSMNKDMDKTFKENEENKILLKRFAEPFEIANVVYFLASEDAKYINSEIIRVDGGYNG